MNSSVPSDVTAAAHIDPARLPGHVAIIMDGNRRWAKERGLPAIEGHRRGIVALREITRAASDLGIPALTVYGFSTENWRRDASEISLLLDLCVFFARNELADLRRNNVRVAILGKYRELPRGSREALESLMTDTAANTGLRLNIAVNYSARSELQHAVQTIARDVAAGRLSPEQIDEERIASYFYTAGLPDPDMLVRPGGEHRLSNFLLYQAAYSELIMSDVYWPDFGRKEFFEAVADFQNRQRRFGGA
ncbi:MAG: isoprenyl transferase [Candidatus Eremiobacteraeota bacterium]|nr:isoprenyl transferase [Candidatus Eremiobacteraeota bacterium]